MAVLIDVDLIIDVYQTSSASTAIGSRSAYATTPHPGTGKTVDGWSWDKRTWPSDVELKATDYAPNVFDPSINFVPEENFQAGIGDNFDLVLADVTEEQSNNKKYWVPKIYHGHFYMHDEEWYLYSDDARKEIFDASLVDQQYLQYKELAFKPKVGVPISVRRYKWNNDKSRYEIDLNFRKKIEFTGILDADGVEAETVDDNGDYQVADIDVAAPEFVVEYGTDGATVVLNDDYRDQVGVSGQLDTLEFLGISDGLTNEYHLPYAPVDTASGTFQLISWDPSTSDTESWSRINSIDDFTTGSYNEFKLDEFLGIVTFGDYDDNTASGAGAQPPRRHKIGAVYTKSVEVTYEPENSRDYLEPIVSDANPLHNATHEAFFKISSQSTNPFFIQLVAPDLEGSAGDGYSMALSNQSARLVATVRDAAGNLMEGETVEFEMLAPIIGDFNNGDTTAVSLTNTAGQATAFYKTPSDIDDFGAVANVLFDDINNDVKVSVEGLIPPNDPDRIFIFKILSGDPAAGISEDDEEDFYDEFFEDEGIEEDASGSSATASAEQAFRQAHDLLEPITYTDDEDGVGTKVLVLCATGDSGNIDPRYGYDEVEEVLAPDVPVSIAVAGGYDAPVLEMVYSNDDSTFIDPRDDDSVKGYFVVCDTATRIRARVTNPHTGKVVYSNAISLTITIPDHSLGMLIPEVADDVPDELFKRPKNIDEISDASIIATEDILYDEYLEDRTYSGNQKDYSERWQVDAYTIGYWPLESGSLVDRSPAGNNLTNPYSMQAMPNNGFVGGAYRSTGGYQYLASNSLYEDLNLESGSVDFMFKNSRDAVYGSPFTMMQVTATGTNGLRNNLELKYMSDAISGVRLRFNYETSGMLGGSANAFIEGNLLNAGLIITDTAWHTLRVTWDMPQDSSTLTLGMFVDDVELTDGFPSTVLPHRPAVGTAVGGLLVAVVGDLTSSGGFYFDEIRYSTTPRDDIWPYYSETMTFESYIDWFRRTRKGDSERLGLQDVEFSGTLGLKIPTGFRLKSPGITVASKIDKATYLQPNDYLPDDYFDE